MVNPNHRKGWHLMATPDFGGLLARLQKEVAEIKAAIPDGWRNHVKVRFFARLRDIIANEVPDDPGGNQFRQGKTLGAEHKHWRRVKFMGRYRLFFRYDAKAKVIIYGWLNDENTLRKKGSKNDPYAIFRKRLENGDPPNDWDDLLTSAQALALPDEI